MGNTISGTKPSDPSTKPSDSSTKPSDSSTKPSDALRKKVEMEYQTTHFAMALVDGHVEHATNIMREYYYKYERPIQCPEYLLEHVIMSGNEKSTKFLLTSPAAFNRLAALACFFRFSYSPEIFSLLIEDSATRAELREDIKDGPGETRHLNILYFLNDILRSLSDVVNDPDKDQLKSMIDFIKPDFPGMVMEHDFKWGLGRVALDNYGEKLSSLEEDPVSFRTRRIKFLVMAWKELYKIARDKTADASNLLRKIMESADPCNYREIRDLDGSRKRVAKNISDVHVVQLLVNDATTPENFQSRVDEKIAEIAAARAARAKTLSAGGVVADLPPPNSSVATAGSARAGAGRGSATSFADTSAAAIKAAGIELGAVRAT